MAKEKTYLGLTIKDIEECKEDNRKHKEINHPIDDRDLMDIILAGAKRMEGKNE